MLLHHALPQRGEHTISELIGGTGWLGVSLFFVLSGFLLTVRYAPQGALIGSPRAFWLERIARLAPTYFLALAFALPLFVRDARVFELSGREIAGIAASVLTLQQAWQPEWACQWACPAWSLSVEAWLYLAFPLIIAALGVWMMRGRARGAVVLVAGLGAAMLLFPWGEKLGGGWTVPIYSLSPLARWPEFAAGIGLAGVLRDWRPRDRSAGIALVGLGVAWLLINVTAQGAIERQGLHLMPVALPGFVALVAGCWALREHPALGLGAPRFVLLGEASYALYLFHAPLHGYVLALTNRLVGRGYDGSWGVFAVYLVLALALAIVVHGRFELPWRSRLRARFGLSRRAT